MKRLSATLLALVFACTSLALAQDESAKKAKTEDKKTKSFTCGEKCGFGVRTDDEAELVSMVQMHSKGGCACCSAEMSEAEIRGMMKEGKMKEEVVEKEVKKEMRYEDADPPEQEEDED